MSFDLLSKRIHLKKYKIVYKLKMKIYDLLYKKSTYVPEKGVWILTRIFPSNIAEDICGITDVFKGSNKKVEDWIPIYSEYIHKNAFGSNRGILTLFIEYITGLSDYRMIHYSVVKSVKEGKIDI